MVVLVGNRSPQPRAALPANVFVHEARMVM